MKLVIEHHVHSNKPVLAHKEVITYRYIGIPYTHTHTYTHKHTHTPHTHHTHTQTHTHTHGCAYTRACTD